MNYEKIAANFLVSFCTAALAVVVVGATQEILVIGLIAAILQGGLSVGAELQNENKDNPPRIKLANLVLF